MNRGEPNITHRTEPQRFNVENRNIQALKYMKLRGFSQNSSGNTQWYDGTIGNSKNSMKTIETTRWISALTSKKCKLGILKVLSCFDNTGGNVVESPCCFINLSSCLEDSSKILGVLAYFLTDS